MTHTRYAFVKANWHADIVDQALVGFLELIPAEQVDIFDVPGAFELPLAAQHAARTGRFDAIITLGCVIRGDTPHFDYVCSETTRGIGEVGLNENLPVAFGLLTTDNLQQSLDRSGDNEENKGEEAALTILEMLAVFQQMQSAD